MQCCKYRQTEQHTTKLFIFKILSRWGFCFSFCFALCFLKYENTEGSNLILARRAWGQLTPRGNMERDLEGRDRRVWH